MQICEYLYVTWTDEDRRTAAAQLLKALGNPHRVGIVETLADGPRCVHELVDALDLDQPLVSQHRSQVAPSGATCDPSTRWLSWQISLRPIIRRRSSISVRSFNREPIARGLSRAQLHFSAKSYTHRYDSPRRSQGTSRHPEGAA